MIDTIADMINLFKERNEFVASVQYTAARFQFSDVLIEKDFLCSLILKHLYNENTALIFKGGTLLSKVHAGFNRMSEDLDFMIPMPYNATRQFRSQRIKPIKELLNNKISAS